MDYNIFLYFCAYYIFNTKRKACTDASKVLLYDTYEFQASPTFFMTTPPGFYARVEVHCRYLRLITPPRRLISALSTNWDFRVSWRFHDRPDIFLISVYNAQWHSCTDLENFAVPSAILIAEGRQAWTTTELTQQFYSCSCLSPTENIHGILTSVQSLMSSLLSARLA